ncbi:MAG: PD-(D/E)XK nuclease family protein [Sandaracinaceae bacterium]|nr:PD-(D/E)XK nuclease family protein [Sandaracinaceae bacterium]
MEDLQADFRDFVLRASELRANQPAAPSAAFGDFAARSRELLLRAIASDLPRVADAGVLAKRWCPDHDLLAVARIRGKEDPVTELVAWALAPATDPASALDRQHAFLRLSCWPGELPQAAVVPRTQYRTTAGAYADLILAYPERVVVVEAKWHDDEHQAAQTGELQTVHYAQAVRQELVAAADPLVVFLTPDGRAPRGVGVPVMHAQLALALTRALEIHEARLSPSTREAFRMVFGPLFRWDVPVDLTTLPDTISRISREGAGWSAGDLGVLLRGHELLNPFLTAESMP